MEISADFNLKSWNQVPQRLSWPALLKHPFIRESSAGLEVGVVRYTAVYGYFLIMPVILHTHSCDYSQEFPSDAKQSMGCQAAEKGKTPMMPLHPDTDF